MKTFILPVPNRSTEIILSIIRKYIAPGYFVKIHFNKWRAYDALHNEDPLFRSISTRSESCIFTMLKIPIIVYPSYKIVRAILVPSHEWLNVFTFLKINHSMIAIDQENNHYILHKQTFPIYYIKADFPCEVLVFTNAPGQLQNCEKGHILSSTTLWITLTETQTWLYSTKEKQKISINCNSVIEDKIEINGTGKIKLMENYKVSTPDLILRTKTQMNMRHIKTHLPDYNLTYKTEFKINSLKYTSIRQLVKNPEELTKLSLDIDEIEEYLKTSENRIFSTIQNQRH
ncbi:hypothetical protein ALC57_00619 [Trachymyrmex cornetzi]|uniref:Uncharacterized protein n=1 Tax=Trachymyrmex cornetzi TaxID=471704 RepID=A0A151JRV2_9HYME|nr:hypothetical protein ALC57_00619 [Trachymyrmex cornetzi]